MASPITVGATPVLLIDKNPKRSTVLFQNTGSEPVFVKRWFYTDPIMPEPSPSNYDFVLNAKPGEGNKEDWLEQIASVSGYVGVTEKKTSTIAVMETVKVVL